MLPPTMQRIALDRATRRANEILKEAFKQHAPQQTGALRRSVGVKVQRYKSGEVIIGIVGSPMNYTEIITSKTGRSKTVRPAKYLHLVERGTKKRQTKTGKNRGAVYAKPIVKPAYDQVGRIFEEELEYELKKIER
jgi:HK97 gp10 family phage protein